MNGGVSISPMIRRDVLSSSRKQYSSTPRWAYFCYPEPRGASSPSNETLDLSTRGVSFVQWNQQPPILPRPRPIRSKHSLWFIHERDSYRDNTDLFNKRRRARARSHHRVQHYLNVHISRRRLTASRAKVVEALTPHRRRSELPCTLGILTIYHQQLRFEVQKNFFHYITTLLIFFLFFLFFFSNHCIMVH